MRDQFRRQCRPALGTFVEIALHQDDLPTLQSDTLAVFDAAFAQIDQVQQQLSFHSRDSELSRINRSQPGSTLGVSELTYTLLDIAMQVFTSTKGFFDCGVAAHLVRHHLLPDHGFAASQGQAASASGSSIANLRLNRDHSITVTDSLCLDLGGIAKGFAVDQASAAIQRMNVNRGVVNAGGDLRVSGDIEEEIFLRHPAAPGTLIRFGQLSDGALATSAPYYSLRVEDGKHGQDSKTHCALFDPSGTSLIRNHSYTVIAPSCAIADALTKAVAVAFNRSDTEEHDIGNQQMRNPTPFHCDFLTAYEAQAFLL